MDKVGQTLREAREMRGMSIEHVAEITKVPLGVLRALEDGNRAQLPAAVYVRGFVRAYAVAVGLDAHEVLRRVRAELDPPHDSMSPRPKLPPALGKRRGADVLFGETRGAPRGLHASHLVLFLLAAGMFFAAWLIAGERSPSHSAAAETGQQAPEIQQRVDAVGSFTR